MSLKQRTGDEKLGSRQSLMLIKLCAYLSRIIVFRSTAINLIEIGLAKTDLIEIDLAKTDLIEIDLADIVT